MPCGVIDFGDVTRTLRVCELAVAASIAFGHEPDEPICAAAEIVRGFDAACPLDDAELEALPHLIAARAAIVAVGTEQQALLEPHNAYAQRVRAGDWAICETAAAHAARARRGGLPAGLRAQRGRARAARARRRAWPLPGIAPGARASTSPPRRGLDAGVTRRPARSAPTARRAARDARALERRAGDDPPRPRPLRPGAAARCARRWRVASSAPASASSCWRPTASPLRLAGLAPGVAAGESVAAGAAARAPRRGRRAAAAPARAGRARRGSASCPGLATPALAAAPGSRSARDPGAAARAACARTRRRARAARAPPRRDPAGPAALLRRAARDRARPAPAPLRRAGSRLPRLRQQRRRDRSQPPARDRGRRRASCACSTPTRASSTRA